MEHCVRSALVVIEGKDHRKVTFGTGARTTGLEPFARRRRTIYRKVSGTMKLQLLGTPYYGKRAYLQEYPARDVPPSILNVMLVPSCPASSVIRQ
jgi:hypothetical protein